MTQEKAEAFVKELNELCKKHDVHLAFGGWDYVDIEDLPAEYKTTEYNDKSGFYLAN